MPKTVSPREIQRSYRQIFDGVQANGQPVVVMKHNQPEVAIIPANKLGDGSMTRTRRDEVITDLLGREARAGTPLKDEASYLVRMGRRFDT